MTTKITSLGNPQKSRCGGISIFIILLLLLPLVHSSSAEPEPPPALATQRNALMDAIKRADAPAVAKIFSPHAKLIVSGFDAIPGDAIPQVWAGLLASGTITRLELAPNDIETLGETIVETGNLTTFGNDGTEKDRSNYLIVWKQEAGEWKIYRDIATAGPARGPSVDRVGFPKDYRSNFKRLTPPTLNSSQTLVQTAYGSEKALSTTMTNTTHSSYPNGTVLAMEFAKPLLDPQGKPLLDSNGNPQPAEVDHLDVMRRGKGFGEAYGKNRAGEWEFAGYHLDGAYSTPPAKSAACAECHLNKAGIANDFVFPLNQKVARPNPITPPSAP